MSGLLVILAGCASAGGSSQPPDDSSPGTDAIIVDIDAQPIDADLTDAMPVPVALTQNTNATVTGGSFACTQTNFTRENSYYRVFALTDHGITGTYQVQSVKFGIETANAGGTSQPAQVKIGLYAGIPGGTLDLAMVTPIASAAVLINDGATSFDAPINGLVPPGGKLIVELAIPDGLAAQNVFFIGTNAAGESKAAYIRSPTCNINVPTGMNAVAAQNNLPKADAILTVSGVKF